MKNYSEMSDFEINKAVIKVNLGVSPLGYPHASDDRSAGWVRSNQYHWYDYCNSWADAGPIIEENGIAILPFKKTTPAAFPSREGLVSNRLVEHKNVLRAAMIVFLMMQESK